MAWPINVAARRSHAWVIGIALLTESVHLSMSMGAFVAGVTLVVALSMVSTPLLLLLQRRFSRLGGGNGLDTATERKAWNAMAYTDVRQGGYFGSIVTALISAQVIHRKCSYPCGQVLAKHAK